MIVQSSVSFTMSNLNFRLRACKLSYSLKNKKRFCSDNYLIIIRVDKLFKRSLLQMVDHFFWEANLWKLFKTPKNSPDPSWVHQADTEDSKVWNLKRLRRVKMSNERFKRKFQTKNAQFVNRSTTSQTELFCVWNDFVDDHSGFMKSAFY